MVLKAVSDMYNLYAMLKIILFSWLLFPKLAFTQNTIGNTGSKISSDDARAILDHHNKIRNDLHLPPLTWSADLAGYAQGWADSLATSYHCQLIHRENKEENTRGYGENLYEGSSAKSFKPIDASLAWYSEIEKYTYGKLDEDNWYNTAHYTQMIWKNTTEVGLGIATCPDGGFIVVANYNPPGNYIGEFPY
jgi:pathogenesis-related protein 1